MHNVFVGSVGEGHFHDGTDKGTDAGWTIYFNFGLRITSEGN